MLTVIMEHLEEIVAVLLFCIGFTTLLLRRNIIKKIIGFNIMDTAIYLFLTSVGYIEGRTAPIMVDGVPVLPKADDERHFLLEVGELELPWIMLEDPNEVISPANEPEFLERMYERMIQRRVGEFFIGS